MRNYLGNPRWFPGVVTARTGPVSYHIICSRGQEHRRHIDQLEKRESSDEPETVETEFAYYPEVVIEEPQGNNEHIERSPEPEAQPNPPEVPRYSLRTNRNPPTRYGQ